MSCLWQNYLSFKGFLESRIRLNGKLEGIWNRKRLRQFFEKWAKILFENEEAYKTQIKLNENESAWSERIYLGHILFKFSRHFSKELWLIQIVRTSYTKRQIKSKLYKNESVFWQNLFRAYSAENVWLNNSYYAKTVWLNIKTELSKRISLIT